MDKITSLREEFNQLLKAFKPAKETPMTSPRILVTETKANLTPRSQKKVRFDLYDVATLNKIQALRQDKSARLHSFVSLKDEYKKFPDTQSIMKDLEEQPVINEEKKEEELAPPKEPLEETYFSFQESFGETGTFNFPIVEDKGKREESLPRVEENVIELQEQEKNLVPPLLLESAKVENPPANDVLIENEPLQEAALEEEESPAKTEEVIKEIPDIKEEVKKEEEEAVPLEPNLEEIKVESAAEKTEVQPELKADLMEMIEQSAKETQLNKLVDVMSNFMTRCKKHCLEEMRKYHQLKSYLEDYSRSTYNSCIERVIQKTVNNCLLFHKAESHVAVHHQIRFRQIFHLFKSACKAQHKWVLSAQRALSGNLLSSCLDSLKLNAFCQQLQKKRMFRKKRTCFGIFKEMVYWSRNSTTKACSHCKMAKVKKVFSSLLQYKAHAKLKKDIIAKAAEYISKTKQKHYWKVIKATYAQRKKEKLRKTLAQNMAKEQRYIGITIREKQKVIGVQSSKGGYKIERHAHVNILKK